MTGSLLELRSIGKKFMTPDGGVRAAVDDVDLIVRRGQVHGLVGESGSGKSTLGRIAVRLTDPDDGQVLFGGRDLLALRGRELREVRRGLQVVFQDSTSSLDPRFTARELVMEPWAIHRMHAAADRPRLAEELLARVGIPRELADRRPGSFSGGQRQRIGIARAIALEPKLLVCDEPVSALDLSVQAQIINLLLDLQRERGMALLFIAHDLALVRHVADVVSVMYLGRIVETGTRDQVFGRPLHPYTRALLDAASDALADVVAAGVEQGRPGSPGCSFRERCAFARPSCAGDRPDLADRGQGHPVACQFPEPWTSTD